MTVIRIEKIGGIAGFGGTHLKSFGEKQESELSPEELTSIEALFVRFRSNKKSQANRFMRDGFAYQITRRQKSGIDSVIIPEAEMPTTLTSWIVDSLE